MSRFTFIDLFAGIGGFHLAMDKLGGECVFASEIDEFARKTYELNHKLRSPGLFESGMFNDDIRKISPEEIPDFDVLCAGFPCQPFSQAGYRRGFDDAHNSERGNLFFNIADILEAKRPKAFFLENVRGLATHDNGNTFRTIVEILRDRLGYSVYHKIVKATDYGLPQHRPRTFIVGFRNELFESGFQFPPNKPLKYNLSQVFNGICSREIGFTLRVGGRGSSINDRRNWDSYLVNGEVKRLGPSEGKKLQGFPDEFEFPVSEVQAMKQLGNSVAVNAIYEVGKAVIDYMEFVGVEQNDETVAEMNKGEWSEVYTIIKILSDGSISLSNEDLQPTESKLKVEKVTTDNVDYEFLLFDGAKVTLKKKNQPGETIIDSKRFLSVQELRSVRNLIRDSNNTFDIPFFTEFGREYGISFKKGGTSHDKRDISLDFNIDDLLKRNEGFGIKSYLGSRPTLLNASTNTNFIYEVIGLDHKFMDEVNSINSRSKIRDRIDFITELGGKIRFFRAEKDIMNYNLEMVDSSMPTIIGYLLLKYYQLRISSLKLLIEKASSDSDFMDSVNCTDRQMLDHRLRKLLIDYSCGFFPGKKWNGRYTSNGTIVVDNDGELHGFHILDIESFKGYLMKTTIFDTPSSGRHGFGSLFKERNGKMYLKLNLQLRCS